MNGACGWNVYTRMDWISTVLTLYVEFHTATGGFQDWLGDTGANVHVMTKSSWTDMGVRR